MNVPRWFLRIAFCKRYFRDYHRPQHCRGTLLSFSLWGMMLVLDVQTLFWFHAVSRGPRCFDMISFWLFYLKIHLKKIVEWDFACLYCCCFRKEMPLPIYSHRKLEQHYSCKSVILLDRKGCVNIVVLELRIIYSPRKLLWTSAKTSLCILQVFLRAFLQTWSVVPCYDRFFSHFPVLLLSVRHPGLQVAFVVPHLCLLWT